MRFKLSEKDLSGSMVKLPDGTPLSLALAHLFQDAGIHEYFVAYEDTCSYSVDITSKSSSPVRKLVDYYEAEIH